MQADDASILDMVEDGVVVRDARGLVLGWNAAAARLYGFSRDQAQGRPVHELLSTRHPLTVAEIERRLLADGAWEGEVGRVAADGRDLRVGVRWRVRRDADGALRDVVEIARDLGGLEREARQALETEHRYRNLFHATAASFWDLDFSGVRRMLEDLFNAGLTDPRAYFAANPAFLRAAIDSTRVVDVNDKTLEMFGATRAALVGATIGPFWPEASQGVFAASLMAAIANRPNFVAETVLSRADGSPLEALLTVAWPVENKGKGTVLVGVIDISEQAAARRALERAQADLAHAARVAMLGELTASIAHEVNQPLAAIVTNGEAGLRWLGRAEPDVAEARVLNSRMVADARRAADIIARIRQMAQRGEPRREIIAVRGLVEEAAQFLGHEIQGRGASLALDLPPDLPEVAGDRTQLQQVVVNLAMNALQAMAAADSPLRRVTLRAARDGEGLVRVTVEDTGPGIPEAALPRLFDSFFTTRATGMGMGLSICRSIVEAHGGTIEARNVQDGGAIVGFTVPAGDVVGDVRHAGDPCAS
ncbi:PAS domain-containing sensor histidine kinase [Caulobacter flavus]|uniref:histidine kinase n=1 Tax=Caulobacter flavus TaxID=1679497 RepID=A0A2N5CKZ2_9CAUL|nr:ATP-binding protein [Caulobacter flavus]AYV46733.1 PAS domain-containing sensor histidine kinase [Caulobacter flavus]PLR06346.1 PAS domain-containing sensor histidine kinase [Caulobacter flavus]